MQFQLSRRNVFTALLALLLLASAVAFIAIRIAPHAKAASGSWSIQGTQIIDPNGNPFVAKGVNVIGPNWVWPGHTTQDVDSILNVWKFNLVRVDMSTQPGPYSSDQYDSLDSIIQTFTSRGVPVVIAPADNPAANWSDTSKIDAYRSWLRGVAATYKNNSAVWYDVVGENGDCSPANPTWLTANQALLSDIRGQGANNIFITEGNNWGQEGNCGNAGNIPDSDSDFLTYGDQLFHFNNTTYNNILFSIHVYDEWSTGDSSRMGNYLDRINAKGWAIYIGEFGNENNGYDTSQAVTNMYGATVPRGIGRGAVWHWYNASGPPNWGNALTTAGNGTTGASVNDPNNPTNLSWLGQQVWNDTHSSTPVPSPVPTTQPTVIPTVGSPAPGNSYEAENATLSGGAQVDNNHAGYSGTGFVDGYWNQGASTTFTVNVSSAGNYNVDLRYANATGNTNTLDIYVNGTLAKTTSLANLANWDTWGDQVETLSLNAGSNTIAYTYDLSNSGNVNLDKITLKSAGSPGNSYEAENATLSGGAQVDNNHTGYSGTGFVDGYWNQGASTTFAVNVSSAGNYNVDLRYGNNMGNTRTLDIYVNGTLAKTTSLANLANWDSWGDQTETLSLNAGSNTIAYTYDSSNNGNVNLDKITLTSASGSGGGSGGSGTVLNRSGWTASASASDTAEWPSRAIDGDLTTRWTTGHSMTNGDWFQVDMGSTQSFSKLVLDNTNSNNDYARQFQVFVSNDGSSWGSAIASGSGSSNVTTITFSTQSARYIRVVETANASNWWSIDEFNVYS
jgi:hypothetical protein